jgi:hypothetical protein
MLLAFRIWGKRLKIILTVLGLCSSDAWAQFHFETPLLATDRVQLSLVGENGGHYRIEDSEDLVHWRTVHSGVAENGRLHFETPLPGIDCDGMPIITSRQVQTNVGFGGPFLIGYLGDLGTNSNILEGKTSTTGSGGGLETTIEFEWHLKRRPGR